MIIAKHIPILQILIPFFAALISAASFNKFVSWLIATTSIIIALALSVYAIPFAQQGMSYEFGNWNAPIGIEYRLDMLNQPIIIFINFVLLFFLIFGKELIEKTITNYIKDKYQHIFYSLLLFAHVGYLGIISTNDLFNIYVFIEISSLATYVLMSKGSNARSLIGAFDYLIVGTIGATLILIGIGFFLAITGSLNISDVSYILQKLTYSKLIITAIAFFLTGAILKMAFFPMHFWMIRAYSATAPFILTYLAAISSILGVYIILRFLQFTIDGELIHDKLTMILRPIAMTTILVCTFLALKADTLKKVIIYSTASQIGYIFLLMTMWVKQNLLFQLIILDAINKIALFTIISHIENKSNDLRFQYFKSIENSVLFKILVAFALIFSAGIPITSTFLVKLKLFDLLLEYNLTKEFIVVLIGSILGLLYHFKLAKTIFFSPKTNGTMQIQSKLHGLIAIVIIQILSLLYLQDLIEFLNYTQPLIAGITRIAVL